jgi:predicted ribosomally synthesized peptide with nif11-like leader
VSQTDIKRFADDVRKDTKLQSELVGKSGLPAIVDVASRHGYKFSVEEVQAFTKDQAAQLSEMELEGVAGGVSSPTITHLSASYVTISGIVSSSLK